MEGKGGAGGSRISDMDKKYFREIFEMNENAEKKIDSKRLFKIFEVVGFEPNEKQKKEFEEIFLKKPLIDFKGFLDIFSLKSNDQIDKTDVKNAFRLLSKEYTRENMISLTRVKELLQEMGLTDLEVVQLTSQLTGLRDSDDMIDFNAFVDSAF